MTSSIGTSCWVGLASSARKSIPSSVTSRLAPWQTEICSHHSESFDHLLSFGVVTHCSDHPHLDSQSRGRDGLVGALLPDRGAVIRLRSLLGSRESMGSCGEVVGIETSDDCDHREQWRRGAATVLNKRVFGHVFEVVAPHCAGHSEQFWAGILVGSSTPGPTETNPVLHHETMSIFHKMRIQSRPLIRDIALNRIASGYGVPAQARRWILSMSGHDIDPTALINPKTFYGGTKGLTIGPGTFLNYGCFFDLGAATTLGSNVAVGYEVMFITCSHEEGTAERRSGIATTAPIQVGDGAWIGARAVIMPGVTIGEGCIIASGSVVRSDCKPHSVYAGVPARFKRELPE